MTDSVVNPTNPPINGGPNIPPLNPTPGFNPPPALQTPPAVPAQQPVPQVPAQPQQQPAGPQAALQVTPELAANEISGVPDSNLRDFDIGTIDDPVIKSTAEVLLATSPDIDLDRALGKALKFGTVDLIDEAYLKEAGGAQAAQLITLAKALVTQVNAKAEATTGAVHALAGGEQQWNVAVTAFNTNAPLEQRKALADMLDSGNEKWIKYAAQQIVNFSNQSGVVPNGQPLVQTGQAVAATGQALTKAQFQAENAKLDKFSQDYAEQYNALVARRQQGRNLGLQ